MRRDAGVPAWRYLYSGEFPNQSLGPCCPNSEGAWHGSEIALIFGTTEIKKPASDTPAETKLALEMRKAWTEFAKDPVHGLHRLGWPSYDPNSKLMVRLRGARLTVGRGIGCGDRWEGFGGDQVPEAVGDRRCVRGIRGDQSKGVGQPMIVSMLDIYRLVQPRQTVMP